MPEPTLIVPPTLEQLQRYADHFNQSEMLRHFGVVISFPSLTRVRADMPVIQPAHRGGLGTLAVNGGVLAALFDLTIGVTAALVDPGRRNATMQLSMSFERPVMGDRLHAEGFVNHQGASTLASGAEIHDQAGQICARAQGFVKLGRGRWNHPSPGINEHS